MRSVDHLFSINGKPELVFALVGGAGTRLKDLSDTLKSELTTFGYQTMDIRLSDLLVNFKGCTKLTGTSEFERIKHLQDMGNAFRGCLNKGDALARAAIAEIQAERVKHSKGPEEPAPAQAYILHQLKHPNEVDLLRHVYGPSFLLIAGHARHTERVKELARRMARKEALRQGDHESEASKIIRIDEKQDDDKFGQNTRDTYPRADFFANLESPTWKQEVQRFVELLFGHPFHTPKPDEYAMYQANAVSLRSSDYNRQVGAVIGRFTRHSGKNIRDINIIAVGMNEVPRGGYGGYYCELDSPDVRDQVVPEDRAFEIKISILTELVKKILQKDWVKDSIKKQDAYPLADDLLKDLKGTQFLDIGEFSRPVHAEMAALIDAARRGVAVDGHSMYVTTFPCHNCVKHIIAAGIQRVVYLEPYPKSRALDLYREEIAVELLYGDEQEGKVAFFPFSGVAPRQYPRLFSMSERGAKKGYSRDEWNAKRSSLAPLYLPQNASLLYLTAERQALDNLPSAVYSRDKTPMKR